MAEEATRSLSQDIWLAASPGDAIRGTQQEGINIPLHLSLCRNSCFCHRSDLSSFIFFFTIQFGDGLKAKKPSIREVLRTTRALFACRRQRNDVPSCASCLCHGSEEALGFGFYQRGTSYLEQAFLATRSISHHFRKLLPALVCDYGQHISLPSASVSVSFRCSGPQWVDQGTTQEGSHQWPLLLSHLDSLGSFSLS